MVYNGYDAFEILVLLASTTNMLKIIFFTFLFSSVVKDGFGKSVKSDDFEIIGGVDVEIEKYPHQVSLLTKDLRLICGGSILSEDVILSAAHCVKHVFKAIFKIRAGSTYVSKGGKIYDILSSTIHPKYANAFGIDYDVGIIRTEKIILDGLTTKPVQLPDAGSSLKPGDLVDVTGWGVTKTGHSSDVLQFLTLAVVDLPKCREAWMTMMNITDRVVCAGLDDPLKSACHGDSGGPLLAHSTLVQYGIVSFGDPSCSSKNLPNGYTYIPAVRDWIKNATGI